MKKIALNFCPGELTCNGHIYDRFELMSKFEALIRKGTLFVFKQPQQIGYMHELKDVLGIVKSMTTDDVPEFDIQFIQGYDFDTSGCNVTLACTGNLSEDLHVTNVESISLFFCRDNEPL